MASFPFALSGRDVLPFGGRTEEEMHRWFENITHKVLDPETGKKFLSPAMVAELVAGRHAFIQSNPSLGIAEDVTLEETSDDEATQRDQLAAFCVLLVKAVSQPGVEALLALTRAKVVVCAMLRGILTYKYDKSVHTVQDYHQLLHEMGLSTPDPETLDRFGFRIVGMTLIVRDLVRNSSMDSVVQLFEAQALACYTGQVKLKQKAKDKRFLPPIMHGFASHMWATDLFYTEQLGETLATPHETAQFICGFTENTQTGGKATELATEYGGELGSAVATPKGGAPAPESAADDTWQPTVPCDNSDGGATAPVSAFGGIHPEGFLMFDRRGTGYFLRHFMEQSRLVPRTPGVPRYRDSIYLANQKRAAYLEKNIQRINPLPPTSVPVTDVDKALTGSLFEAADFEILCNVGGGNFGRVFVVRYRNSEEALEYRLIMKVECFTIANYWKYCCDEIIDGSKIVHPNLARVLGLVAITGVFHGNSPICVGILMEQCGPNLMSIKGKIDGNDSIPAPRKLCMYLKICLHALYGANALNAKKIYHHDIKPDNICQDLDDKSTFKLIDYGFPMNGLTMER